MQPGQVAHKVIKQHVGWASKMPNEQAQKSVAGQPAKLTHTQIPNEPVSASWSSQLQLNLPTMT